MNKKNMGQRYSFKSILDDYRIEIPAIQRDYAQGREDKVTNNIVEAFLTNIIKALANNKPLDLGFVYGYVQPRGEIDNFEALEKREVFLKSLNEYMLALGHEVITKDEANNQSSEIVNVFIPLDGQQRLTTLFLLHWYLYKTVGLDSYEQYLDLKEFSYSTRPSSQDFLEFLNQEKDFKFEGDYQPSSVIKNHANYVNQWSHDPTVNGMLNVLDKIHKKFSTADNDKVLNKQEILNNLLSAVDKCPLYFQFFNLENLNKGDELYVKMNARGKQLTVWENFKSELISHISQTDKLSQALAQAEGMKDWQEHLDINWYDLFWNINKKHIDNLFFSFFKINFLIDELLDSDTDTDKSNDNKSLYDALRSSAPQITDIEQLKNIISNKKIENIFNLLSLLHKIQANEYKEIQNDVNVNNLLKFYLHNTDLSIQDKDNTESLSRFLLEVFKYKDEANQPGEFAYLKLVFYFVIRKLILSDLIGNKNKIDNDVLALLTVSSKLIANSPYDNVEQVIDAIKALDKLIDSYNNFYKSHTEGSKSFYKWFEDYEFNVRGLSFTQREEEKLKAKIIANNSNNKWQDIIKEAEENTYFYGRIGFLLENLEQNEAFNTFTNRVKILNKIFNENGIINCKDLVFQRALLTKHNYMVRGNSRNNKTPIKSSVNGSLRDRRDNWRRYLNLEINNGALKIDPFLKLLDNYGVNNSFDTENINNYLKNEIQKYKEDIQNENKSDYTYLIIDEPKVFVSTERQIQPYGKNYGLIFSKNFSGNSFELHSHYLYLKLNSEDKNKYDYLNDCTIDCHNFTEAIDNYDVSVSCLSIKKEKHNIKYVFYRCPNKGDILYKTNKNDQDIKEAKPIELMPDSDIEEKYHQFHKKFCEKLEELLNDNS